FVGLFNRGAGEVVERTFVGVDRNRLFNLDLIVIGTEPLVVVSVAYDEEWVDYGAPRDPEAEPALGLENLVLVEERGTAVLLNLAVLDHDVGRADPAARQLPLLEIRVEHTGGRIHARFPVEDHSIFELFLAHTAPE